MAEPKPTK